MARSRGSKASTVSRRFRSSTLVSSTSGLYHTIDNHITGCSAVTFESSSGSSMVTHSGPRSLRCRSMRAACSSSQRREVAKYTGRELNLSAQCCAVLLLPERAPPSSKMLQIGFIVHLLWARVFRHAGAARGNNAARPALDHASQSKWRCQILREAAAHKKDVPPGPHPDESSVHREE